MTVIRAASLASLSPARLGPPLHFLPPARVPPLRAPRRPSPRRALRLIADPTQTPRPAACRDHTHSKHSRREPRTSQTEPQPLLRTQKERGGDDSGLPPDRTSLQPEPTCGGERPDEDDRDGERGPVWPARPSCCHGHGRSSTEHCAASVARASRPSAGAPPRRTPPAGLVSTRSRLSPGCLAPLCSSSHGHPASLETV